MTDADRRLFVVISSPAEGGAQRQTMITLDDQKFNTDLKNYLTGDIKLLVVGNTNVGKSTFLNHFLKIIGMFKTSEKRETACIWILKTHDKYSQDKLGKYCLTKVSD